MSRCLALVLAIAAIAGAGLINGSLSGRWHDRASVDSLDHVLPQRVDAWEMQSSDVSDDMMIPPKAGESARVVGVYTRRPDGGKLIVLLVQGEAAVMVYNPLICYDGSGYMRPEQPNRRTIPTTGDAFWETDLTKDGLESPIRIRWGWGDNGIWQAPDQPRVTFLRNRELFKLYVVSHAVPGADGEADLALSFLAEFLPAIRATLTAGTQPHD